MKVQLFDFNEFYEAADPESWHISGFKEIERTFKIKPVDVRDTVSLTSTGLILKELSISLNPDMCQETL